MLSFSRSALIDADVLIYVTDVVETIATTQTPKAQVGEIAFLECVSVNKTGAFLATNGGLWERNEDVVTELAEFNSADPEAVGKEVSFKVFMTDSTLTIVGRGMVFKRIDDGSPGELQGAWLMSGRKRDGEIQQRDTSRPRKTMKILSGTRFQWIAYNTETKQFMGTGGGTYTTIDGKYTENIEFFW